MSLALKGVSILLQQHYLICNLNYYIDAGDVVTVLGPSGSGKSSLLNFISGTIDSDFTVEGEVWLDGIVLPLYLLINGRLDYSCSSIYCFTYDGDRESLFALPARYSKVERFNRAKQALKLWVDFITI